MKGIIILLLGLLLLAGGGALFYLALQRSDRQHASSGQESSETDYGGKLEHFELIQSTGEKFDSRSLDGQVWIASFFYATCPSECRQMNEAKKKLVVEYGHRGVKFVSITCDAENDTPARLAEEARRYNAPTDTWFFLTGDQKYINKIGKDIFMAPVERYSHLPHFMVVDRQGELKGYFSFKQQDQTSDLRELIEKLLAEDRTAPQVEEENAADSSESTTADEPVALRQS